MFDSIETIAGLLCLTSLVIVIFATKSQQWQVAAIFAIIAIWPLMWAGLVRIHIPQTIIWMGMCIFAILFTWQGVVGLLFKNLQNQIIPMPNQLVGWYQSLCSLVIGLAFATLIILARF